MHGAQHKVKMAAQFPDSTVLSLSINHLHLTEHMETFTMCQTPVNEDIKSWLPSSV